MNLPFYIARRYLFSKKSHNAINIISLVSVCGVAVVTAALVCAMSVLNGFNDLTTRLAGYLDPQIQVTPVTGKVFDANAAELQAVCRMPSVAHYAFVLQDNALFRYGERQVIGILKGVDDAYAQVVDIDSALVDGHFALREDVVDYAVIGAGLAYALGIRVGYTSPIGIYAPKRDEAVNMANPASSFNTEYAYLAGAFRVNRQEYDETCMLVSLPLARALFRYDNQVSSLALRLLPDADIDAVKRQVQAMLGDDYAVNDRYQQQQDAYRMMEMEKLMIFLILTFILVIALFNVIGSLSMLMLEKATDVDTLRKLGAPNADLRRIFLFEGWMIAAIGAMTGIALGLMLCFVQQRFGLIRLDGFASGASSAFIIDAYPVKIAAPDVLLAFATVAAIGFLSSLYALKNSQP